MFFYDELKEIDFSVPFFESYCKCNSFCFGTILNLLNLFSLIKFNVKIQHQFEMN